MAMDIASLNHFAPILYAVLAACVMVLLLWTATVHRRARHTEARLDALLGNVSQPNTAQLLAEYLNTVRHTAASVQQLEQEHHQIARVMPSVVRHVGLVRFSPFHDTGGDQSFALALLDGTGDGVVITGLHSRTDSRLYAKPVERGGSTYTLTPEEREAMARALDRPTAAAGR